MAFLWSSRDEIQRYLDTEGTIKIVADGVTPAENCPDLTQAVAAQFENEAVYEIATYLRDAFKPDGSGPEGTDITLYGNTPLGLKRNGSNADGTVCATYIRLLVAKYAAAKIGMMRVGNSLGQLPNWIREYENDVFAQLQRLCLHAEHAANDLPGLEISPDWDFADCLIKMKPRGGMMINTIDS